MQPIPDALNSHDGGLIGRRGFIGGLAATSVASSGVSALMPQVPRAARASKPQAPERQWEGDRDQLLRDVVRKFEAAEMASAAARRLAERDRDFYDGKQWDADQRRILEARGQPAIVDNFIKEKVNYMLGAERRLRSDPKAYPRTPTQETRADAATQALRYVTDDNVFNRVRSYVFANIAIEGVGGADVVVEAAGEDSDGDVRIHHVPYDRLWWDPYSSDPDFHDAQHMGTVIWGDREQFLSLFPEKGEVLEVTLGPNPAWGGGDAYGDKPKTPWVDTGRKRIRIVTCHWQQDGDWWTVIFCRGGFLHGPVVSPYVDRRGQTCSPLILRSANVDRENNRYGLIRDLIPLQQEVNARRSKLMHLLNTRRIVASADALDSGHHPGGMDDARDEVAKPDGLIVLSTMPGAKFEVDQNTEMSSGQFELLQHTIGRLQGHGPNASMTGKDPRELSGRAISLQQAGGAVEQEPDFDGLRLWSRRIYEAVWMRVRQFWDQPRWLAVTDQPDSVRYVGINHPVTLGDTLSKLPPDRQAAAMQQYGIVPNDPRLDLVVKCENDIGDLDMHITLEEGADSPTMAAEQFAQLMQFAAANPNVIPPKTLIKASSLRNKQQILDDLEEAEKARAESAKAAHSMQMELAQANLAKTQGEAANLIAQAHDRQTQTVQRVHDMQVDHVAMSAPTAPGVGPLRPDQTPLLQPAPVGPAQGTM